LLLALSAGCSKPAMQPHVPRATFLDGPKADKPMSKSCAGELCFPYEAEEEPVARVTD
jgi:hypothetical protein